LNKLRSSLKHGLNRLAELLGDPEVTSEFTDGHKEDYLLSLSDIVPLLACEVVPRWQTFHIFREQDIRKFVEADERHIPPLSLALSEGLSHRFS
jgi:hypothetical protein